MEKIVLLQGQASNSISYYMLLALTISPQQSKQMLREDSELLQKNDKNLYRKTFRENIWHTSKSKKQTFKIGNLGNLGKLVEQGNLVQQSGISLCSSSSASKTYILT